MVHPRRQRDRRATWTLLVSLASSSSRMSATWCNDESARTADARIRARYTARDGSRPRHRRHDDRVSRAHAPCRDRDRRGLGCGPHAHDSDRGRRHHRVRMGDPAAPRALDGILRRNHVDRVGDREPQGGGAAHRGGRIDAHQWWASCASTRARRLRALARAWPPSGGAPARCRAYAARMDGPNARRTSLVSARASPCRRRRARTRGIGRGGAAGARRHSVAGVGSSPISSCSASGRSLA